MGGSGTAADHPETKHLRQVFATQISSEQTGQQGVTTTDGRQDSYPGRCTVVAIGIIEQDSAAFSEGNTKLADALLLDSGRPAAAVKELGGTGRVHDWTLSRRIVDEVARPVFLAGGLRPGNVAEAWQAVRPFGLDLCTGVRTDDKLDAAKLKEFFRELGPARH